MTMTLATREHLKLAAHVIRTRGWHQGSLYDDIQPVETAPVCAVGALQVATLGVHRLEGTVTWGSAEDEPFFVAAGYLDKYLHEVVGVSEYADVSEWNDSPGRTKDEVLAALDGAANWIRHGEGPV